MGNLKNGIISSVFKQYNINYSKFTKVIENTLFKYTKIWFFCDAKFRDEIYYKFVTIDCIHNSFIILSEIISNLFTDRKDIKEKH